MDETGLPDKLADKLAAAIDIPGLPESVEPWVLRLVFRLALGEIARRMPEYVAWIKSAADGIDDSEAAAVTAWIVGLMDQYGTAIPAFLRTTVAGAIVAVLRKGAAIIL